MWGSVRDNTYLFVCSELYYSLQEDTSKISKGVFSSFVLSLAAARGRTGSYARGAFYTFRKRQKYSFFHEEAKQGLSAGRKALFIELFA